MRIRWWLAPLGTTFMLLTPLGVAAQLGAPDATAGAATATEPAPASECYPSCRAGYVCLQGQCVSACNPPCGEGQVCLPEGRCVSACNPPCGPGQRCRSDGVCETTQAQAPIAPGPASSPPVQAEPPRAAKARRRGIYGSVAAGVVGLLAAGAAATTDEHENIPALPLGTAATLLFVVSGPLVAAGGASARTHPEVTGARGARIFGWISYGLAAVDALTLVGLGASEVYVPPYMIASVGLLGVGSLIAFVLDAFRSANQAAEVGERLTAADFNSPRIRWAPGLGFAKGADDELRPTLSLSARF